MNKSKTAITMSKIVGAIQMIIGVFFLATFGLTTIMFIFDKEFLAENGVGIFVFFLILDAFNIWLIYLSVKRKKLIRLFKKYVSAISVDPTGSISNLAAAVGTSEDLAKHNIELMIKRKYFTNAHINYETNSIIISNVVQGAPVQQVQVQANTPTIEYVSVSCKNCGGMNKVAKGQVHECDFCGGPM